jgi:hypothetical protein
MLPRSMIRALALAAVAACGGGGTTTGPGGAAVGTFSAVIDGQAWIGDVNQSTGSSGGGQQVPGLQSMTGSKVISATNYIAVTMVLGYIAGPGTYPLGVNQGTTAGGLAIVSAQQGSGAAGTWSTGLTGAAGTVTIATLSSTRMTGTFQFTAPPQAFTPATGTKVVTNGVFDMPLAPGFTVAPANNRGSKVSATLAGAAWNAATVVALGSGGVFGFNASNDSYSLTIAPGTVVVSGQSYPIGGAGTQMSVIRTGTANTWTSGVAGSVGTLTITSLAGGRASGTFGATLLPGAGTVGSLTTANGTFDVRIDAP